MIRAPDLFSLAAVCVLASCTGGDAGSTDPDPLADVPTFVPAPAPAISIGVVKGSAPYLLSWVSDATRLSDGAVVLANCQSSELRYFDATGRFLRSVGARGRGPGEFQVLRRVFPMAADSIGTYDSQALRVTVLGPDGTVARTVPLGQYTQDWPDVKGWLDTGDFVATRYNFRTSEPFGTHYRSEVKLLRIDGVTGQALDSVVGLPASDLRAVPERSLPFVGVNASRHAVVALTPRLIFFGSQDDDGIVALDAALSRVAATETLTRSAPVTDDVRREFQTMIDDGSHIPRGGIGLNHYEAWAPMLPAFGDIVAGRDGRLWVQDPNRPGRYPLVWTAYDDGAAVARVELAPRFFPFEFGTDWVLGVSYDDLDIERVEVWTLVPGELPGRILPPRDGAPVNIPRCGSWVSR